MALNDVPLTGQSLGVTRSPIRNNFLAIDSAFSVDHVDYNDPNAGRHERTSYLNQIASPITIANVVQMFSTTSLLTSQPELTYLRQAGSTAPAAVRAAEFTSAGWANPGWAVLPSGILLKWHQGIGFVGNSVFIDVDIDVPGSPAYTAIFSAYITPLDTAGTYNKVIGLKSIVSPVIGVADFSGGIPPGTVTFAYLTIGM